MTDYGHPISYLVLERDTPIYSSDGEHLGHVHEVLYVPEKDIFDGVVMHTSDGARFVDAPEVGSIYERGVVLTITSVEAAALPRR